MKLWPQNPPTFTDALDQYTEEIQRVANIMFESIGKSLKLDKLSDNFKDFQQSIRINYYPPCPHASNVIMSNGKYKSLEHRAVVISEQERFSIGTFHGPRADAQIGPLPAETPGKSEPVYYRYNHQNSHVSFSLFLVLSREIFD
ncbi:codeine O-demethylase-like [Dioscorea cayenensis subsp. rotundata]|uniref:Codeine O-demethylase-like n=1 Tax=Dioscorea cayennensis subsp. rotundata TaxID=55577 RepID=A0AB40CMW0_DIOCR|nr:codeine O-demethylase-like [Dioscorea cayenensis subsp. rotundata]